jgi:hypothetical protein
MVVVIGGGVTVLARSRPGSDALRSLWRTGAFPNGNGANAAEGRGGHQITTTLSPPKVRSGLPPYLAPVYVVPADIEPIGDLEAAIAHEVGVVVDFFRRELGGRHPRFAPDGQPVRVVTAVAPWSREVLEGGTVSEATVAQWLIDRRLVPDSAVPVIYIDAAFGYQEACGWSRTEPLDRSKRPLRVTAQRIVLAMPRCDIYPSADARWPWYGTYLLAHETTHALGATDPEAPHQVDNGHTNDDPGDVVFQPSEAEPGRTWSALTLDPGHDDYYRHGRKDLVDIANSELLTGS